MPDFRKAVDEIFERKDRIRQMQAEIKHMEGLLLHQLLGEHGPENLVNMGILSLNLRRIRQIYR